MRCAARGRITRCRRRAVRHGRLGPALLPALRPGPGAAVDPDRSPRLCRRGREVRVVEDASRFPSDPEETILEGNDVAVLLRSDRLDAIDDAQARLFDELDGLFAVTSIRNGFVGGGLDERRKPPEAMAMRARIRGAALIRGRPSSSSASPRRPGTRSGRGRSPTSRRSATRGSGPVLRRRHPHAPVASLSRTSTPGT